MWVGRRSQCVLIPSWCWKHTLVAICHMLFLAKKLRKEKSWERKNLKKGKISYIMGPYTSVAVSFIGHHTLLANMCNEFCLAHLLQLEETFLTKVYFSNRSKFWKTLYYFSPKVQQFCYVYYYICFYTSFIWLRAYCSTNFKEFNMYNWLQDLFSVILVNKFLVTFAKSLGHGDVKTHTSFA